MSTIGKIFIAAATVGVASVVAKRQELLDGVYADGKLDLKRLGDNIEKTGEGLDASASKLLQDSLGQIERILSNVTGRGEQATETATNATATTSTAKASGSTGTEEKTPRRRGPARKTTDKNAAPGATASQASGSATDAKPSRRGGKVRAETTGPVADAPVAVAQPTTGEAPATANATKTAAARTSKGGAKRSSARGIGAGAAKPQKATGRGRAKSGKVTGAET